MSSWPARQCGNPPPVDDLVGAVDPFYNGFAGRMQNVFQAGYASRANNDVLIATPVIGGFSANLGIRHRF